MVEYRGVLRAENKRFAIVVARFNELITDRLLEGARAAFRRHGVADDCVDTAYVPGSLEIPVIAQKMAASGRYAAVVCLGAVIRGATPHFEYVSAQTAAGVAVASRETGVPILFGVLTTDTIEQAIERAGTKSGNKGYDVAVDAIDMASLVEQLDGAVEALGTIP